MKRLVSFILAFIFLGSNLGLAMGTHFCGGHVMETEVILGHADLSCGMMPESPAHHADHPHDQNIHAIPCCANEFQSLNIQDDFQSSSLKVVVEEIAALLPIIEVPDFTNLFPTNNPLPLYSPPIRTGEVTILFQVFRI